MWKESEHPRDEQGQFTLKEKVGNITSFVNERGKTRYKVENDPSGKYFTTEKNANSYKEALESHENAYMFYGDNGYRAYCAINDKSEKQFSNKQQAEEYFLELEEIQKKERAKKKKEEDFVEELKSKNLYNERGSAWTDSDGNPLYRYFVKSKDNESWRDEIIIKKQDGFYSIVVDTNHDFMGNIQKGNKHISFQYTQGDLNQQIEDAFKQQEEERKQQEEQEKVEHQKKVEQYKEERRQQLANMTPQEKMVYDYRKKPTLDVLKQNYAQILDDQPMYSNESKDASEGGYSGKSMSNRAVKAYSNGQKPMSKWTKDEIMDVIEQESDLEPIFEDLRKLPLNKLQKIALEQSSWHHTGAFANATNFYGVKSPLKIFEEYQYNKLFGE